MDWLSSIYALIIAVLGFALLAVLFNPKNVMMVKTAQSQGCKYKFPVAAIILIVIIIIVGILWAIRHYNLREEGACY